MNEGRNAAFFFIGRKGNSLKKFSSSFVLPFQKGLFSFFAEKRGEGTRRLETPQKTEKR